MKFGEIVQPDMASSLHRNHRERVRKRFLTSGFDSFADHELLELLLFYSISRIDTNDLAHRLIEHFGSLGRVMEALPEELETVPGVGEHSAVLIKLTMELVKRYLCSTEQLYGTFDTLSKVAEYFCNRFVGHGKECLYMMLLNNRMNLIDFSLVSSGSVNRSDAPIRKMTEHALSKNASVVILGHNHPHGTHIPSPNDLEVTERAYRAFSILGITLLEHLVIADDRFTPIIREKPYLFFSGDTPAGIKSSQYQAFYNVDPKEWRAPSFSLFLEEP